MTESTATTGSTERTNERGAVILITSFAMVAVLFLTAIVTDLGLLRLMRRDTQTLVDFAALAGGNALGDDAGPNGPAACSDAVRYLRLNAGELATLDMPCAALSGNCSITTTAKSISKVVDNHRIEITYPVPHDMIADPNVPDGRRTEDGWRCERMRVSVQRTESTIFAGIAGKDELTTTASAVVRRVAARDRRTPSLWLLDPFGCNVLSAQGGAQVTVGLPSIAGFISIDSDGSQCSGNGITIDVGGSGSQLHAIPNNTAPPAAISLFSMAEDQTSCFDGNVRACDPVDVANGTLQPLPVRSPVRVTRAPVDHTYNCKSVYPDYLTIPIDPCHKGTEAHIDRLISGVGASGVPAGFSRWSTTYGCSPGIAINVTGNWVVDCADFRLGSGSTVAFSGGNVIFDGSISLNGSGSLTINNANTGSLSTACTTTISGCLTASSPGASWAYMRSGDLRLNGGAVTLEHTMLYQHDGTFTINGGAPPTWSAPSEGPFKGLSVWSEKSGSYSISGGATMELDGVFFTPYASPFALSGGAPFVPQAAQFISYRARVDGGAVLNLAPNEDAIKIPAPPVALIR